MCHYVHIILLVVNFILATVVMRAFNEISWHQFKDALFKDIKKKIEQKSKEYILGVDDEEFIAYLDSEYRLEPLKIFKESEDIPQPEIRKEWFEDRFYGEKHQRDVYNFTVSYNYTGSPILFKVESNPRTLTSHDIDVNERSNTVSFSFKLYKKEPEEFKRRKEECFNNAFTNLGSLNNNISEINNNLTSTIRTYFQDVKKKFKSENDFFAEINVKVDPSTKSVFTAPTISKKKIPQPKVSDKIEFSSSPTMSKEMYKDILKVIYDSGKSMEKKPSLYIGKDEESLRDQFLFVLETRYVGATATGETFNRSGKTDIILKHSDDGSNLFVAECKFWHGAVEFKKAIYQLFDKYLTWRDSKTAIILFVKNKEFSQVISTIKSETKEHEYFLREIESRGESSFSFEFHLPSDNEKIVFLEVIAFHYDKE